MHMPFIQPYAVPPDMVLPKCSDDGEPIKDMDKHRPVPSVSYGTGWLGSVPVPGLLQGCIEEDNAQLLFFPMVHQEKIGVRELLSLFSLMTLCFYLLPCSLDGAVQYALLIIIIYTL